MLLLPTTGLAGLDVMVVRRQSDKLSCGWGRGFQKSTSGQSASSCMNFPSFHIPTLTFSSNTIDNNNVKAQAGSRRPRCLHTHGCPLLRSSNVLPPSFLLPCQSAPHRNLFNHSRLSTSFWTHSFPPQISGSSQVPYTPPSPNPGPWSSSDSAEPVEGKKKQKKQRYLDSLMDKAGELSLRCTCRARLLCICGLW